jgi:hypothetical protein
MLLIVVLVILIVIGVGYYMHKEKFSKQMPHLIHPRFKGTGKYNIFGGDYGFIQDDSYYPPIVDSPCYLKNGVMVCPPEDWVGV